MSPDPDWTRLDPHRRRVVLLWAVNGATVAARTLRVTRACVYKHLTLARQQLGVDTLQDLRREFLAAHLDTEVC